MEAVLNQNLPDEAHASHDLHYPKIEHITRSHIPTDQAAYYLNRRPQTLRTWACTGHSLIRPIRVNGRLAWNVSEIKNLLSGGAI